jgi:hypothetical protein
LRRCENVINSVEILFRRLNELRYEVATTVTPVPSWQPIEETGLWKPEDSGPFVIGTTDDFKRAMRRWAYETNVVEWQGAVHTGLLEAQYSLETSLAYWKLVEEAKGTTHLRKTALFFFRYYCDNTAHRLFTTRERLAQAVNQAMDLGIPETGKASEAVSFWKVYAKLEDKHTTRKILSPLATAPWKALGPYRHAETHHFDPLIKDPDDPNVLLRLYGEHADNSGSWTSPYVYDGEELLKHLTAAYESLVTACKQLIL